MAHKACLRKPRLPLCAGKPREVDGGSWHGRAIAQASLKASHKGRLSSVRDDTAGGAATTDQDTTDANASGLIGKAIPHQFEAVSTVLAPEFCCFCGALVQSRSAQQCRECRLMCHQRCVAQVPAMCGMSLEVALAISAFEHEANTEEQFGVPQLGPRAAGGGEESAAGGAEADDEDGSDVDTMSMSSVGYAKGRRARSSSVASGAGEADLAMKVVTLTVGSHMESVIEEVRMGRKERYD